jgi:uncharacterized protein (TIGR02246 family)
MSEAVAGKTAAIAAVNKVFVEAFKKGDAAGAAAVYTVDAWALPPGSAPVIGRQAIQGIWQGALDGGIKAVELETLELEFHGDAAFEVGQGLLLLANGQVADRAKYIVVWKRENGEWKWHRDIWNSSPAPA